MKVTIASIELKGSIKFFALSANALRILRQLRSTNCKEFKKRGFWTKHYTMHLWNNERELEDFARSGAHLQAMKDSKQIAKEIRTLTIDATNFPRGAKQNDYLRGRKFLDFSRNIPLKKFRHAAVTLRETTHHDQSKTIITSIKNQSFIGYELILRC